MTHEAATISPVLFDIHLRHVRQVLATYRTEMWTEGHAVPEIVREFWRDTDEELANDTSSGWVEAVRILEVQRREMMRRAPTLDRLAEAHRAAREALIDIEHRLEAIEDASYGTMMEMTEDPPC